MNMTVDRKKPLDAALGHIERQFGQGSINKNQFEIYKTSMNIKDGMEWRKTEGLSLTDAKFSNILANNIFYKNRIPNQYRI